MSELVENLKTNHYLSFIYHSSFVIRRIIFIAIVFLLEDIEFLQLFLFILSNLIYLCFLLGSVPVKEHYYIEVFNEVTTLILSYLMLIYTDFVLISDVKQLTSYVFIGIFVLNIFLNVLLIIFQLI